MTPFQAAFDRASLAFAAVLIVRLRAEILRRERTASWLKEVLR